MKPIQVIFENQNTKINEISLSDFNLNTDESDEKNNKIKADSKETQEYDPNGHRQFVRYFYKAYKLNFIFVVNTGEYISKN